MTRIRESGDKLEKAKASLGRSRSVREEILDTTPLMGDYTPLMEYLLNEDRAEDLLSWADDQKVRHACNVAAGDTAHRTITFPYASEVRRLCLGQVAEVSGPQIPMKLFFPLATVLYCRRGSVVHPAFIHRNLVWQLMQFLAKKHEKDDERKTWRITNLTLPEELKSAGVSPAEALFAFLQTAPPTPTPEQASEAIAYTQPLENVSAANLFAKFGGCP